VRTTLFWVITQRAVVISYRRFGTTYRSHRLEGGTDMLYWQVPHKPPFHLSQHSINQWRINVFFYIHHIITGLKLTTLTRQSLFGTDHTILTLKILIIIHF